MTQPQSFLQSALAQIEFSKIAFAKLAHSIEAT